MQRELWVVSTHMMPEQWLYPQSQSAVYVVEKPTAARYGTQAGLVLHTNVVTVKAVYVSPGKHKSIYAGL